MGCVYMATNRVNGKRYIGKTVGSLSRRIAHHITASQRRASYAFGRALAKHGPNMFEWSILFSSINDSLLLKTERTMIAMFRTRAPRGYNLTDGGDGACGAVHSEETRAKRSAALKGKKREPFTQDHRDRMSLAHSGVALSLKHRKNLGLSHEGKKHPPRSVESRARYSAAGTGKKHTDEARAKISAGLKGRLVSAETRKRISDSQIGRKKTPEQCAKYVGRITSDITREKMRAAWIRRKQKLTISKGEQSEPLRTT
jgi:group I intron endonuclease